MAMDKLFKGILQYKSTDTFTKEAGFIYFVREFVDGSATGNAEVWFGTRKYGDVEATKLADLTERLGTAEGKISDIENALGKWTEEFSGNLQTVATVVKGHDDKLSGIEGTVVNAISSAVSSKAESSTVTELAGRVTTAEGAIDAIEESLATGATAQAIAAAQNAADAAQADVDAIAADYLKSADKTELDGKITTAQNAADAAQEDVDVIAADYLKSADKTALESKITAAQSAANKAQGDVDVIAADYLKAADKTELDGKITAHTENGDIHVTAAEKTRWSAAAQDVEDFFYGALEDGAEQVKDTLREIQDYITSDASAAAEMTANIKAAKDAADAAQGEVDALEEVVATKAAQSDLNELAGRVTTAEGEIDTLQESLAAGGATAEAIKAAKDAADAAQGEVDALEEVVATKAAQSDLTAHTGNNDIHVTTADKTNWNSAVQTVTTLNGDGFKATKEGTTVTLALYYGGDDAE